MTILKTIQEVNAEREKEEVTIYTFKIPDSTWKPTGILCPCGCDSELLELLPRRGEDRWRETRVKCSKTDKQGTMVFDGSLREAIKEIIWDDLSGTHFGEINQK